MLNVASLGLCIGKLVNKGKKIVTASDILAIHEEQWKEDYKNETGKVREFPEKSLHRNSY